MLSLTKRQAAVLELVHLDLPDKQIASSRARLGEWGQARSRQHVMFILELKPLLTGWAHVTGIAVAPRVEALLRGFGFRWGGTSWPKLPRLH